MWKKILAGVLILAGLILIFSNQINEQYVNLQAKQTIKEARAVTPEQIKENTERTLPGPQEDELYDFSQVEPASLEESLDGFLERMRQSQAEADETETTAAATTPGNTKPSVTTTPRTTTASTRTNAGTPNTQPPTTTRAPSGSSLSKYSKSYIIGILKIPKINLELGVLRGILNNNLYIGAGTMRKDQVMGERNYPIAGHHMRWWEVLFNRVPELSAGDIMYITDKQNIYTYRVYANLKVHESETRVIYDNVSVVQGKPVLTLVTCFNRNEPDTRVIIHGELVDVQPYSEAAFTALR